MRVARGAAAALALLAALLVPLAQPEGAALAAEGAVRQPGGACPGTQRLFEPGGLGGAGGMYCPTISPHDPQLLFVASDMGGVFRSENGGKTWTMIHFREGLQFIQLAPPPVFFPDGMAWVTARNRVTVSRDRGCTWRTRPAGPWKDKPIRHITALPGQPDVLLVATVDGVWRAEGTAGTGEAWQQVLHGKTVELLALGDVVRTFSEKDGFVVSTDRGRTWVPTPALLGGARMDGGKATSMTGGMDEGELVLLAAMQGVGIIRSVDAGATWARATPSYQGENLLVMAPGQTRTAYAAQTGTVEHRQVLRSTDGGRTWQRTFRMAMPWDRVPIGMNVERSWVQTQLGWGYYITAKGLGVNPAGDGFLLVATQGDLYASRDGGDSWSQIMTRELPPAAGEKGPRLRSIGLEITSTWNYVFDVHDPERHYIAYTDIGFARSTDRGETWQWGAKGAPWTNTFYDVAPDPVVPGRMYAAASMRHDIPHYTELTPTEMGYSIHANGGVVMTDDHAATWKVPYALRAPGALPNQTCTTVALDERSPVDARVLYAGLFGEGDDDKAGVYKSMDGGRTWERKSKGLGAPGNLHVYRVRLHPRTRHLYCLITGLRGPTKPTFFNIPGGLWRSTNGGESWQNLTLGSNLAWWSTNFSFDPSDDRVIYVSAATAPGHWQEGGVYKTTDGGGAWRHILTDNDLRTLAGGDNFDNTMVVVVHPDDPRLVYVGTTLHGLIYSRDGGATWKHYAEFPFASVLNVVFDPASRNHMIVTTFGGGIWSGPHLPPDR
ncbi:hypothetical protein [Nitratidesulfovibrio sp.]|uniref:WD40/YVTN/BNR-like repeat-containing protein n=1 Tax=Nitratidesulfovibrio sp. TaxID=2802297 RepID=UPI00334180E3